MATLTETAYYTRRAINWSILAVIAYFILRIFWSVFVAAFIALFPPKPPPPTHAFGKLPPLEFPDRSDEKTELTLTLETISGTVPEASASGFVFFMPKAAANLLAITEAQEFAKTLQLNQTPVQETKNIYRFEDDTYRLRRLRYDIVSNNFILNYDFTQDIGLFSDKVFKTNEQVIREASLLLSDHDLDVPDIEDGTSTLTFLKLSGDSLFPTGSRQEADAMKVDFFRAALADVRVFTPYPDDGQVSIIFSGSRIPKKRVIQYAYTFWPIDYKTYATYSLKSSIDAWNELLAGEGYIARYPTEGTEAVIRDVYLGYYDSFEPQTYLQPIFVFEGDNGFLAYVPAINPEWTE